jgi:hypothetical protein
LGKDHDVGDKPLGKDHSYTYQSPSAQDGKVFFELVMEEGRIKVKLPTKLVAPLMMLEKGR